MTPKDLFHHVAVLRREHAGVEAERIRARAAAFQRSSATTNGALISEQDNASHAFDIDLVQLNAQIANGTLLIAMIREGTISLDDLDAMSTADV